MYPYDMLLQAALSQHNDVKDTVHMIFNNNVHMNLQVFRLPVSLNFLTEAKMMHTKMWPFLLTVCQ